MIFLSLCLILVSCDSSISSARPTPDLAMREAPQALVVYHSGKTEDTSASPLGGLLLVGGDEDRDDAMDWFVDRAGRGDIVVLRASGADGYNDWLLEKGASSVTSFVFGSREAASDTRVLAALAKAEGVFFAGGDQSLYMSYWKETPVEEALAQALRRGAVLGGTSAGLAVLGEFVFSARQGSAESSVVMKAPFDSTVTVERGFLDLAVLRGVITDSHFSQRQRLGRLLTFMSRIFGSLGASSVRGLGVDEQTALAIDEHGVGTVYSDRGKVFALEMAHAPTVCQSDKPLTTGDTRMIALGRGARFDLRNWEALDPISIETVVSVIQGQLISAKNR
jgi:cyanophycinase